PPTRRFETFDSLVQPQLDTKVPVSLCEPLAHRLTERTGHWACGEFQYRHMAVVGSGTRSKFEPDKSRPNDHHILGRGQRSVQILYIVQRAQRMHAIELRTRTFNEPVTYTGSEYQMRIP